MGSFVKNSFLRRSQQQSAPNDLSSGMYLKLHIYSKCEGLTKLLDSQLQARGLNLSASAATLQTEPDLMESSASLDQAITDANNGRPPSDKMLINYSVKYGS